ncbi:MAG: phosphate/phosphite/phosphonate ABC transporter substrate-binding protein [Bacteroidetes bacterium]|nr:phosphate/phosphite/phosphonate ABC transporter substrate-binding protein [Bacteroidota bacterium]
MKWSLYIVLMIFGISCTNSNKKNTVDFSEVNATESDTTVIGSKSVYIAIASMTSPKETHIYYSDLMKYISKKVGFPIYIKQKKTYEEVNSLLENSEVDFAFICSGAYVEEYKKSEIRLLVAPEIENKTFYNAYIIAHKDSKIEKFKDFEGKSFAFTDPLSNTGRLYPKKKLFELKKKEESFFQKTIFTYGHDISIQMVNRGIIDGASVHGLIFDYLSSHNPDRVKNIMIIEKSEEFGMPPIVSPKSITNSCFDRYQQVFLDMHKDSIGNAILEKLNINRYVTVDDSIYNSVFQLKEYIENASSEKSN